MGVAVTLQVQAFLDSVWEDLTPDTVAVEGCTFHYGIQGNGPLDVCCSPGELAVTLNNAANNSGGVQGYYSPQHANARTGWGFGVPIRVRLSSGATSNRVKWYGRVTVIDPEPGQYLAKRVRVIAQDQAYDLMDADVSSVAIAVDQTESELIGAVLTAAPAAAQPIAQTLDTGIDTIQYAFSGLGESPKALDVIRDIALSSGGLAFIEGDGTFRFVNRHTRSTSASQLTVTNTMHGLEAPSSLDNCWNRVIVTRPAVEVADSPTVFWTAEKRGTLDIPEMDLGATVSLWVTLTNAAEPTLAGAIEVTVDSATTIYQDIVGNPCFDVTVTGFGSTAKVDVEYVVEPFDTSPNWPVALTLDLAGRIITDLGEQVFTAAVTKTYDRVIRMALPYAASPTVAQGMATLVADQYADLQNQFVALTFLANDNDTFMQAALLREVGDRITIVEAMTGLSADAIIYGVDISIRPGPMLTCRWELAPATPWAIWSLGEDGFTELGETTVLGF